MNGNNTTLEKRACAPVYTVCRRSIYSAISERADLPVEISTVRACKKVIHKCWKNFKNGVSKSNSYSKIMKCAIFKTKHYATDLL